MRLGADDYLVKPLLESVVLLSLERALHKRHLEQQVEDYRQHLEEMVVERTAQLQAALQQIEASYEDTLEALGAAIDLRDSQTAGHSQRSEERRVGKECRSRGLSDVERKKQITDAHVAAVYSS